MRVNQKRTYYQCKRCGYEFDKQDAPWLGDFIPNSNENALDVLCNDCYDVWLTKELAKEGNEARTCNHFSG